MEEGSDACGSSLGSIEVRRGEGCCSAEEGLVAWMGKGSGLWAFSRQSFRGPKCPPCFSGKKELDLTLPTVLRPLPLWAEKSTYMQ